MYAVIINVNGPLGQAIGIKEWLAMMLEPFGDVRVVKIEEIKPEQKKLW